MGKQKKCEPRHHLTRGYKSCGQVKYIHKYGLCSACFYDWMQNDERGKIYYSNKFKKKVRKNIQKNKKEKNREFNIGNAMRLADKYFSRYIRLKYSNFGKCTCYTCGMIKDIKEVDNGHYMKREHKSTRYNENNCRPQCKICNGNTKHNGKQAEFRVNLVNEIGEDEVYKIELLSRQTIKANYKFYKEIADEYRKKINELQKQLKVKYW